MQARGGCRSNWACGDHLGVNGSRDERAIYPYSSHLPVGLEGARPVVWFRNCHVLLTELMSLRPSSGAATIIARQGAERSSMDRCSIKRTLTSLPSRTSMTMTDANGEARWTS